MEPPAITVSTAIEFVTSDGVTLSGDLAVPTTPTALAIVCHPHPQYGGNRFNSVVEALFRALPAAGVAALRFDFRAEFGGGVAERTDARSALAYLDHTLGGDLPRVAVGYSFGAMVVLGLATAEPGGALAAKVLIAPPLTAMEVPSDDGGPAADLPTLLLAPVHDQFTPFAAATAAIAAWPKETQRHVDVEPVDMADHFLAGRAGAVAERTVEWLTSGPLAD